MDVTAEVNGQGKAEGKVDARRSGVQGSGAADGNLEVRGRVQGRASAEARTLDAEALGGKYKFSGPNASGQATFDAGYEAVFRGNAEGAFKVDGNGTERSGTTKRTVDKRGWLKADASGQASEYSYKAGEKTGEGRTWRGQASYDAGFEKHSNDGVVTEDRRWRNKASTSSVTAAHEAGEFDVMDMVTDGLTLGKGLRSGEKQDAADGADGNRCEAEGVGDARSEEDIAALELAQQILQENGYAVGLEDLEPHH